MIVHKMPVLMYFDNQSLSHPITVPVCTSDYICNKYKDIPSGAQILIDDSFESGANVNVIDYINNEIGDTLVMKGMQLYINDPNDYHSGATVTRLGINEFGLTPIYGYYSATNNDINPTRVFNVNDNTDFPVNHWALGYYGGNTAYSGFWGNLTNSASGFVGTFKDTPSATSYDIVYDVYVYPEAIVNKTIDASFNHLSYNCYIFDMRIHVNPIFSSDLHEVIGVWVSHIRVAVTRDYVGLFKETFLGTNKIDGPATQEADSDNPYGITTSQGGGGNGHYGDIDSVEGTPIPDLPDLSAAELGFITMYNPTKSQLIALSSFMWSGLFDLDTYKKLFSDPMESIIGLSIVPVAPTVAGSKNVMFGSIDSGVSMSYLSTQYVQFNCGSVSIEDYVGSFLDYSPYTKISIYLPYIGIHELSPEDIMNDTINVTYNIDVLSGACGAFVSTSSKGVLYSYNGSCISNIPLTSINFSSAIQNAVSAVCSGAAIVAGVASGNAPITAMGATSMLGSAANTALNSKPTVQRSGSLGGSAGVLSVQKPYLIIERPNLSVPMNVQRFVGQTSNITAYLGNLSGFTMVEYVHIEGVPATEEEIKEIEQLLKEGVYL